MKQNKKKYITAFIMLFCVVAWGAAIFNFSSINSDDSNNASNKIVVKLITKTLNFTNRIGATNSHPSEEDVIKAAKVINPIMRKLAHFSEYFILAVLVLIFANYVAKWKIKSRYKFIFVFLICLVICAFYALSDEFHQLFISGRTGQIVDACIDTSGAFCGLIFYTTYHLVYKAGERSGKNQNNN